MANIRKQAIVSSILSYTGFLIGAINIYLYTRQGVFTEYEFGLTRVFFDFAQNLFAFGSLGAISVMYKFYPYYKDNLADRNNDLLTLVLTTAVIGFTIVCIGGYVFQPLVIRKFIENSPLFLDYYFWVFPFGMGMLFFFVVEAFMWALHRTVLSNFLKETGIRLLTTLLIVLRYLDVISFPTFIKLFSFLYVAIFLALLCYLIYINKFHITFTISRVTRKYWRLMVSMQALVFSGNVIRTIGQTIDGLLIASLINLPAAGIYTLAQYVSTLVQVPQRSLEAISTGVLAQAWKDKNYVEINRIYQRTSINLLLMAFFIYGNIVLNVSEGLTVLGIKETYQAGIQVMIILGVARLIDAGTGVNNIIIGTSNNWRFDFISGVVLLLFVIPTNYLLVKNIGIEGSAYANVISFTIYNLIRFEFLRRKFNMQPFSRKTGYSILLAFVSFITSYFLFRSFDGWTGIFLRSIVFSGMLLSGVFVFELTPDAMQLYYKFKERNHKS
ncbi:lipopolysaccharide biosynthesis protein [Segetibacter sp. 3557_3]|uniref:polysaccharide biosynthesis C-terminal domain-containing protein n=1 Tax=Segetibacter sp. 3557_3 TaxID=2547429 RepID=UPI001058CA30|nr:polysaccharide biosynthesis C-terminal domain-containing protein [Segetibacter sp. 3557_3]TDH26878.1 lipopolysaccharide biosynthesis protein [Segetibacter sp. 3557_3]